MFKIKTSHGCTIYGDNYSAKSFLDALKLNQTIFFMTSANIFQTFDTHNTIFTNCSN